jgi:hypothetical protein
MYHDNPLKYRLAPAAMTDRYVDGHDVGGPLLAEPVAGHTGTVEAVQRTHKPRFVLEVDSRRVMCKSNPRWRDLFGHVRQCTSIDVYVRRGSYVQVGGCLLWPYGMG